MVKDEKLSIRYTSYIIYNVRLLSLDKVIKNAINLDNTTNLFFKHF